MNQLTGILLSLIWGISISTQALAANTAVTDQFNSTGEIPVSARTTFNEPLWTSGDAINTAHHEIIHAIGYTVAYYRFSAHVDGSRQFRKNRPAGGTILAKLLGAAEGTHVNPQAGTVNGHDQATSVMGPIRVAGQRMAGQEQSVLDEPFWDTRKLSVTVNYMGNWTPGQKAYIEHAKSEAEALYSSGELSHNFSWTVRVRQTGVTVMSGSDLSVILSDLNTADDDARMAAMTAIFSENKSVAIRALINAGAQPMASLNPPLPNVILSVLLRQAALPYKTDSIGLHTAAGTSTDALSDIGKRHGFVVPNGLNFNPEIPNIVYVDIAQGMDLWSVMESVLTHESRIENINVNFFE